MGQSELVQCNTYRDDILLTCVRFRSILFQLKFANNLKCFECSALCNVPPTCLGEGGGMETNPLKLREELISRIQYVK